MKNQKKLFIGQTLIKIFDDNFYDFCEISNFSDDVGDFMDLLIGIDGKYYI